MKKLFTIILCAIMVLSFTACSRKSDNTQIPNPFLDCKTIKDAEEIAGFKVTAPQWSGSASRGSSVGTDT